jgi:hypothetical protein
MAQVQTDSVTGPPFSECIEKYLATREQDLDPRTLNQHRLALERLQRFLGAQNVVHIREMTVDHLGDVQDGGACRRKCGPRPKQRPSPKYVAFSVRPFGGGGSKRLLSIR